MCLGEIAISLAHLVPLAAVEIDLQCVSVTSPGQLGLLQCVSVKLVPVSGLSSAYARCAFPSSVAAHSGTHTGHAQTKKFLKEEEEEEEEEKNRTLL